MTQIIPTMHQRFAFAQLIALAVLISVIVFYPSSSLIPDLLRYFGAWVVADFCYRRLCPVNQGGRYALLVAWLMLAIGVTLNSWWFTTASGGTPSQPVLLNNDSALAWNRMTEVLAGAPLMEFSPRETFGTFLALLSAGGTPAIGGELTMSMLATLIAIVLTGAASGRMALAGGSTEREAARISTAAMILTGSVSYFLASGTLLLKDPWCCMVMATLLFAVYGVRRLSAKAVLAVLCIGLSLLIRHNLLPLFAVAFVIASIKTTRGERILYLAVAAASVAAYVMMSGHLSAYVMATDGTSNFNLDEGCDERLAAYNTVAGGYVYSEWWRQALYLPFSLVVQYLIPLPWAFGRDVVFGPTQAWAHVSYLWYAVGCIILFYLFFRIRRSPWAYASACVFGVFATVATAYITGGTVSRYCLPWLPWLVPGAAWLVATGGLRCKAFKLWAWCYAGALAVAMCVVFWFLHKYSPGGWQAV
ncbi:MAG: hypothetical protein K2L28_06820 [Muribaculaceae bacterium]|nr:hypothetical protein [Muribaculaceae bacterium]